MVEAIVFGLPAGGNCKWQQTLDLRQAGIGEASKEKESKKIVTMSVNAKANGCNFDVSFRVVSALRTSKEFTGKDLPIPLGFPFLLFKAHSTQGLRRQLPMQHSKVFSDQKSAPYFPLF